MKARIKELRQRVMLAIRIIRSRDSNLVAYAQRELVSSYSEGDKMSSMMANHLIDMVRVFSAEGHSGFSAGYAVSALSTLLRFEPLGALTGEDSEWVEVGTSEGKPLFQNRRCGRVFKEGDRAYDIEGVIFREPGGACFTSRESRVDVAFPYTPKTVYADITADADEAERHQALQLALRG